MAKVQQQGQKPAYDDETVAIAEPEVSPFRHYEPGERPRTDPAYFELLLLKVLRVSGVVVHRHAFLTGAAAAVAVDVPQRVFRGLELSLPLHAGSR